MREGALRVGAALAVVALAWSAMTVPAAFALEPGVHVDPGSPAAKEYSLPLTQARQTGSTSSPQQGSEGNLFGAGIKPPGTGGGHGSGKGATHSPATPGGSVASPGAASAAGSGAGGGAGAGAPPPSPQAVLRAAREQGSSGGGGSTIALIGGAVAILVLGAFGGTILRHSRRPRTSA
ncbi:MAG: hypothetical protein JWL67_468 [Solirubrobacterales bacterium]|nr:hypothetical protein [Solirubrobacterales bacterium]